MSMVRVETTDLERKAAQLSAQLPVPPGLPLPADGLKIASDGLSLRAASAQKFAAAISNGQAQASRLSQSFTSAAATYRTVDQNVSGVLNNDGAASTLAPVLAAAPSASPSAPADVAPGTRPSATFTRTRRGSCSNPIRAPRSRRTPVAFRRTPLSWRSALACSPVPASSGKALRRQGHSMT